MRFFHNNVRSLMKVYIKVLVLKNTKMSYFVSNESPVVIQNCLRRLVHTIFSTW